MTNRRTRWARMTLAIAVVALAVAATTGWQIYLRHEPDARVVIEWDAPIIKWRCDGDGEKTICRPPMEEGWYDPTYSRTMEGSLPDYADTPTHTYRIRDLMGRRI